MPVYYDVYSGSIPDKTYLEFMMTSAKDLGLVDVCFLIDQGFVSKDNFEYIVKQGYSFITSLPKSRLEALRLIDENKGSIRKIVNRIGEFDVYGVKLAVELDGLRLWAHVFFDSEKQAFDEKELYLHIDKLQKELLTMNRSKDVPKRYRDYFNVKGCVGGVSEFVLDEGRVDVLLGRCGFFVLLSSQEKLGCGDVLRLYRDKDVGEKGFWQFKCCLDFRRVRTHWRETLDGKVFVGFLALILRSYMSHKLKSDVSTRGLSFEKVFLELKKIRVVTMGDGCEVLLPLTKLQRTILSVLGVPIETLSPQPLTT
jgi:transposase